MMSHNPNISIIWAKVPLAAIAQMTRQELQVYAALASFQGKDKVCFPTLEAIAERIEDHGQSQIKTRRISQVIQQLKQAGWITVQRRGYGRSNLYQVHTDSQRSENLTARENPESRLRAARHDSRSRGAEHKRSHQNGTGKTTPSPRLEALGANHAGNENQAYSEVQRPVRNSTHPKSVCHGDFQKQRPGIGSDPENRISHSRERQNGSPAMDGMVRWEGSGTDYPPVPGYPPEDQRTLRILRNLHKSAREMSDEEAGEVWDYLEARAAVAG